MELGQGQQYHGARSRIPAAKGFLHKAINHGFEPESPATGGVTQRSAPRPPPLFERGLFQQRGQRAPFIEDSV